MPPTEVLPGYRNRWIGVGYDVLNGLLWLPTGSDRLRRLFVRWLDLGPDDRVLELGCGTGLVTRHLVAAGASVTALDGAPTMLARARRRVPAATFVVGDVVADVPAGPVDVVVLAFVLHELDHARRVDVLRAAADRGARVAVLEWSLPAHRPRRAAAWRRVVGAIEPAIALEVLDGGVERAVADAGLRVAADRPLAGGRARAVLVVRA